ncbi:MAG: hypothetical protein P8I11_00465 [Bacteroidia bacterium]|nr:hypothetical protein [Bacteroidia bacterium]
MNIDQKTYELINLYLSGELSGPSLDTFKARLKKDNDLKKKVQLQKALIDCIKEVRSQELKKFITDNVSSKNKINRPLFKTGLSIAASILLILAIFFSIRPLINKKSTHVSSTINQDSPILSNENSNLNQKIVNGDSIETQLKSINTQLIAKIPAPEIIIKEDILGDDSISDEDEIKTEIEEVEEISIPNEKVTSVEYNSEDYDLLENDSEIPISKKSAENNILTYSDEIRDDSLIQKDLFLANSNVSVRLYSNIESKDSKQAIALETYKASKNYEVKRSNSTKSAAVQYSTMQAEYWKSVVGFSGYKYDGNTIQLYGIIPNENIELSFLDNRLYLKKGGEYYEIKKSNKTNKFSVITNPILLKVLNE